MHDYLNHCAHKKAPSETRQQMECSLLHSCLKTLKENENDVTSYQVRVAEALCEAPPLRTDCSGILYFLMRHEWFWLEIPVPPCHWCLPTPPVNVITRSDLTAAETRESLKRVLAQKTVVPNWSGVSSVLPTLYLQLHRICCCGVTAHMKGFKMLKASS